MDPDKDTFFAETAPAVDESVIDAVAGQTAMDGSNDVAQEAVLENAHEVAPATEEAEQETTEKTLARVDTAKVGSHEVPVEEAAVVGVVEDIAGMKDDDRKEATAEKVIEDDDPIAAVTAGTEGEQVNAAEPNPSPEEDVAEVTGEQPLTKEAASATQLEVSENPEISIAEEVIVSEVKEIVAQVTDELVEAVQLEQHQTEEVVVNVTEGTNKVQVDEKKPAPESAIEEAATGESKPEVADVPKQENEAADNTVPPPEKKDLVDNNEAIAVDAQADTVGQNPAEEETDSDAALASAAVPASAVKEVSRDSCRKSSDNNQHGNGVVLGLLPRLGPSSGTTTTTSIEPFVLSSESNEMLEAHVPPQRWVYEVYGFSIENRVVYYHIHKSDRRTGIREPPILKRYTDFRELHIQLLDTRLHVAMDMPRIPRPHLGTVFRGYKSKKTIEIRETAFRAFLRYISQYPALHGSAVFERFITTTRATTGAGWM